MSSLKILPHTCYQVRKYRDEKLLHELNTYQVEIPVVYNRDGEYLLGDKCWFEVRGRAFLKRKEDFLYELYQYHMLDVDINTVRLLEKLSRLSNNTLTKEQRKLILHYNVFLHHRNTNRLRGKRVKDMNDMIKKRKLEIDKHV